ncbi:unnamed protein product [Schistosoma margrebowiei]|uniref:C2H2-type domain-containing protein n=1 Tax=Schistosoma margrebowiei TaxID=48269 RepID=A0AA85AHD0_9TREM|nr:unnamed protein product [Schistosoma margrebowiei]
MNCTNSTTTIHNNNYRPTTITSFVMDDQLKSDYCLFNDSNVPIDLSRNSSSSLNHYDEFSTRKNTCCDKCIDPRRRDEHKCVNNEKMIMNKYYENNILNDKFNQFMNTTDNPVFSSKKQSLSFCQNSQSINPEFCHTYKNYDKEHRNILTPSKIPNNNGNNSTTDHKCRFMIKDILEFQDHPSSAKNDDDNMNNRSKIRSEESVHDSKPVKEFPHPKIIFCNENNKSVKKIRNKQTSFCLKTSTTETFESSLCLSSKNMRFIPHFANNVNNNNYNYNTVNQIEKIQSYMGDEQENRNEDYDTAKISSQNTSKCYSRQYHVDYQRFVQDKKRQNCSTCNLSFCQPVDFVLHIQKVHLGLKLTNNENNLTKPLKESLQSTKNHKCKSQKIHRNVDDADGIHIVTYANNNDHERDQMRNNKYGNNHPLSLKSTIGRNTRKRSYKSMKKY